MCGITGKLYFSDRIVTSTDISKMNGAVHHRGPDDTGIYISDDKKLGLGHCRLSIVDLSDLGHQPMRYMDRYVIVFNGEIYNFQQQRSLLEKQGYKFQSKTDTEVILALYDRYQEGCLAHLRGMFAFAIYDEKTRQLFCARDRVGKKPFKYHLSDNTFIFASELKAILTQPDCPREPDLIAINHYLSLQYCPAPLTGFKGIQKLPPGHFLKIDLSTKHVVTEQYWRLRFMPKQSYSEAEWSQRIMHKLDEAVRLRMIADVPLGAFLSGGIDSSAIVGLMSKHSATPIKTFSIGFEEEQYNELRYARQISSLFGSDHQEFIVKPDAIAVLPKLVHHYEEPYADSSALATYYLSELTRQHVTVALNGDGGDENFAGYGRYSVQKFALQYDRFKVLHNLMALPMAQALSASFATTFFDRAYRFAATLGEPYAQRYLNYICYFPEKMKQSLMSDKLRQVGIAKPTATLIAEKFQQAGTPNKLDQTLFADIVTYLPDDLLVKVDIATMIVALEGRSPFLDHEFMELTAQIPFNLKLRGRNHKKYILKQALRDMLPAGILQRPKMGFGIPIEIWFRGKLKEYAEDILLSPQALSRGLFKEEKLRQLLYAHAHTKVNYANHIWALLTLELWFREFFD